MTEITPDFLAPLMLHRTNDSHKGNYGHALLICGCSSMPGAAVLATGAALKSGCGLVSLHSVKDACQAVICNFPSAMLSIDANDCFSTLPANLSRYSAIGIGPGLGKDNRTKEALGQTLEQAKALGIPMVLDADALNIISENQEFMSMVPEGSVLTPHLGELKRLIQWDSEAGKEEKIIGLCSRTGCVLVHKGFRTRVYTPDGECLVNTTGNPGMAKGGSGDVLTGLTAGLLARGYKAREAAAIGVWVHGKAGDCLTDEFTAEAWSSRDMVGYLYKGFKELL